jgi:AcrR family transcriptional regulator
LWQQTIDAHRREVREAILETTAGLVAQRGLRAVTMSEIADETGIGRATLYKYFPSLESILLAWHQAHVDAHLQHLAEVRDQTRDPGERLEAVVGAYALVQFERGRHRHTELAALVHQDETVARAEQRVGEFFRGLLAESVQAGFVRDDVPPAELTGYCLNALSAATSLRSKSAVHRLVTVVLDGLRPRG